MIRCDGQDWHERPCLGVRWSAEA